VEQLRRSDSRECSTQKILDVPLHQEATGLLEHFAQGRSARCVAILLAVKPCHSYAGRTGSYDLVVADLNRALPDVLARAVRELFERIGIHRAYQIRREVVNLKKVCLLICEDADSVHRELKQLRTFFYSDCDSSRIARGAASDETLSVANAPDGGSDATGSDTVDVRPSHECAEVSRRSDRYARIIEALARYRGADLATRETRRFLKDICSINRHPVAETPAELRRLFEAHGLHKLSAKVDHFVLRVLANATRNAAGDGGVGVGGSGSGSGSGGGSSCNLGHDPCAYRPDGTRTEPQWPEVCQGIRDTGWPAYVCDFLEQLLIARGAAKAIRIVGLIEDYTRALLAIRATLSDRLSKLDAIRSADNGTWFCVNLLENEHSVAEALRVTDELHKWIALVRGVCKTDRLFVAADADRAAHGSTMFLPKGFQLHQIFGGFRKVVEDFKPDMLTAIRGIGWPPSASSPHGALCGTHRCMECNAEFAHLWLFNHVCSRCEATLREQGACPFNRSHRAMDALFCPHRSKCFACDHVSCSACRLTRGEGEEARLLVEVLAPHAVFVDFDRTLASTKSGANPLVGTHSVDADLAHVCATHANVHVVTRNSHCEEIAEFCERWGVHAAVHCVSRMGVSKAALIRQLLAPEQVGVFIDDDIREHVTDGMHDVPNLHRFLLVRAT
jgi:hypothetical protein